MTAMRRVLGVFVMLAGVLGLLLSLAGLVGVGMVRPVLSRSLDATVSTLAQSVETSTQAMQTTTVALEATVQSVDALAAMLNSTAKTVEDTQPVFLQVNSVMGETLPAAMQSATDSLEAAQAAAASLEAAMESLDTFRSTLGAMPFFSAMVKAPEQKYAPEKPLAASLGDLAKTLDDMPATFTDMSANIDKADDNLEDIGANLTIMADSAALISQSLRQYQDMMGRSQASFDNLNAMLAGFEAGKNNLINGAALALGIFFLWLLAAQVVIFSQGLELYRGSATHMEGGPQRPAAGPEPVATETVEAA